MENNNVYYSIVNKAILDQDFKKSILDDPSKALLDTFNLKIREGHKVVAEDQGSKDIIYINIPRVVDFDSMELTEEELELVACGATPAIIAASAWSCAAIGAAAGALLAVAIDKILKFPS
ncbi:NHLP leader peptide domain [Candidatus Ornithobacterium hominis]|uniref:NHLP leader peptide domain n=1 Tax=Candidatus Ornithobacterium hominis TaxID=2497989 RepID=A0A383TXC3_9FLAO|nr:hypothetical protein [Candidatus Ornithobacterium hominis]MCT7904205.1 hypothetical protein [Candidatus Ornithobacterium hominis]SZD72254.1 NHLP leader peptide domain [Candidatus Ornithobacterium hominis]